MYKEIPNGTYIDIPDNAFGFVFRCWIPPVGYGINIMNGKLQGTDVLKRSDIPEEQYWERILLPKDYKQKRLSEKKMQAIDKNFYDPYLEDFRRKEWNRRLCGVWFWQYNPTTKKSEPIYITGQHYLYINWWVYQGKKMDYREPDRETFYIYLYCQDDPYCLGTNELTQRKNGKTGRTGCVAYERTSRLPFHHCGIQSKTDTDGTDMFKKAFVQPWRKLPDFYRPVYDLMKGDDPNDELRFFATSRRGQQAEAEDAEDALESWVDVGTSEEGAYDGPELHTYISDETGKCFEKGTKIRMFDGTIKNVENILEGEYVMGDDSTKRKVYGVTSGSEQMYKIVPKKGESWGCNESHILSLKWCTKRNWARNWDKGQVVNISVKDFLLLKKWEQNHLMLYKKAVEYRENKHLVDPYFLGLWLGDGSKKSIEISTIDEEVIDYISVFAKQHNLVVNRVDEVRHYLSGSSKRNVTGVLDGVNVSFATITEANKYFGYCNQNKFTKSKAFKNNNLFVSEYRSNKVRKEFNRLDIIKNKHIPSEYLIDSRQNRLHLLAGLIDSDGYLGAKNGKPTSFEVTQKIRRLAYEIKELALSLGFYCSVCPKVAKMKRVDKSVYECVVYRVQIYGDLHLIPTKIKRKIAQKTDFHVNRRNPNSCGFKIEKTAVGEYFGFAVDGNSLFLLSDGTVVHNTRREVSVKERQRVVKMASIIDGEIKGFHMFTTTVEVEEGEDENEEFEQLTAQSNPLNRNKNGMTMSGLYTFFQPADKYMYFDQYGFPDKVRAREYLMSERQKYIDEGDMRGLSSIKRKKPLTFKEAFSADGVKTLYNPELINGQLDNIKWRLSDVIERGDLVWKDGFEFLIEKENPDGSKELVPNELIWTLNPNGEFEKVKGWFPRMPNAVALNNGQFIPNYNYGGRIGCDPFKYDKTKDQRRSNCAGFYYQMPDPLFPDATYDDMFTLKYSDRPEGTTISNRAILKMAWWCGCQVLFERNVNHWKTDFNQWNSSGFLMWMPGEVEPGLYTRTNTATSVVQTICNYTESYINKFISKVFFPSLMQKRTGWLGFKVEETEVFDEPMAAGITLVAVHGRKFVRPESVVKNIEEVLPYNKAI